MVIACIIYNSIHNISINGIMFATIHVIPKQCSSNLMQFIDCNFNMV